MNKSLHLMGFIYYLKYAVQKESYGLVRSVYENLYKAVSFFEKSLVALLQLKKKNLQIYFHKTD